MKKKFDLSIGMIVKNEEKNLENCLKSLLALKDEISCELIITDTGSTDETIKIAEKYADKVIHHEWCDDFSNARNVGIKAVEGAWFMYIDADEILDENISDIVNFIKSDNRDDYDRAVLTQRNYFDENKSNFNDVKVSRLYNFVNSNREFVGTAHEYIESEGKVFVINTTLFHFGYVDSCVFDKNSIKKKLLDNELEKNPYDIRIMYNLLNYGDLGEKINICNKAFDLIEDNYSQTKSPEYLFLLYITLIAKYVTDGSTDLVIETYDSFSKSKYVIESDKIENLAVLEIYYICANDFYNNKNYEKAIDLFLKYQELYLKLKENSNMLFFSDRDYNYNTDKFKHRNYLDSFKFIISSYISISNFEEANKYLEKSEMYKSVVKYEELMQSFIQFAISCDRIDLFDKAKEYYNENNIEYNHEKLQYMLIGQMYFYKDISYFIENCNFGEVEIFFEGAFKIEKFKDVFTTILLNDIDVGSLKEMRIYLQLTYWHLVAQIPTLKEKDITKEFQLEVENIFIFYVETTMYYLKEVYQSVIFQKQNLELLSKSDGMCSIIIKGLENKDSNRIEYIKALRNALEYNSNFKYIILNSINVIENELNQTQEVVEETEFDLLSKQIKKTITDLISQNQIEQAKLVLNQYKTINPNDPDIEKFENLMI